jgi:hypothetical protein
VLGQGNKSSFQVSSFRFRVSGFKFQVSGCPERRTPSSVREWNLNILDMQRLRPKLET